MTFNKRYHTRNALLLGALPAILLAGCGSAARGGVESQALPWDPALDSVAMTPTAGAEYLAGPDDLLDVRVFGAPELSGEVRVSSSGELSLPLIGTVPTAGLTPSELEDEVEVLLKDAYMWDPRVTVQVLEARSHAVAVVYVIGDVTTPGGFPLSRGEPVSVLQALALAEGLLPTASRGNARIIRREGGTNRIREEVPVDLDRLLDGTHADPVMSPADILFVPNSRPKSIARGAWDAFVRVFSRGLFF